MGQPSLKPIQYGVWTGPSQPGQTRILRHPDIGSGPLKAINKFGMTTLWDAMEKNINVYHRSQRNFLGTRKGDHYEWRSYKESYDLALNLAKGLEALQLCPEFQSDQNGILKFLGLYSRNREEWIISDLACCASSCTTVTLYDTLGDLAMEFILKQTQLFTLVVEGRSLNKILSLGKNAKTSNLKNLIVLENDDVDSTEIKAQLKELGFTLYTFNEIIEKGKQSNVVPIPSKPETICTVCYTSGTTGLPKGALISQRAFLAEVDILSACEFELTEDDVYLSFLPLAHNMERLIICVVISRGISVGFFSGDTKTLMEDAKILKPTGICGVPRIFQRIYEAIQTKLSKIHGLKKRILNRAISDKLTQFRETGIFTHAFWDRVVFNQFRSLLGGRLRVMLTGSAPMPTDILNFLKIAFSVTMFEGYGQTEDCSGMILTRGRDPMAGHLGGPGWANEVKLVDVPELSYLTTDPEPRGEICIRGPTLFDGYLNDEEHTKEAIDEEGWLHTGDIGLCLVNYGNSIKIIDRKKNIFKLSQGEYIAPEKLENVLIRSQWVGKIMVHGDSFKNYLIALIVPRRETVVNFLKEKGIEVSTEECIQYYDKEDLKDKVVQDLTKLGKENDFKGFELVKKVLLCKEDFTIKNDLLTPTLKVKRHNLKKKYQKEIEEMYG